MKKLIFIRIFILITGVFIVSAMTGQNSLTFTFTGTDNALHFQTDSIKVKNLTQDCDTMLYYPDTMLTLDFVGVNEKVSYRDEFRLMQNFPNPVSEQTSIDLYVPGNNKVFIIITDAAGRQVLAFEKFLEKGLHTFLFNPPGIGLYFFSARTEEHTNTIKMLSAASGIPGTCRLEYAGATPSTAGMPLKNNAAMEEFMFVLGDELLLIGYGNGLESGFQDSPETSKDYVFQFATNIPCPGLDSLFYDGQWYHTIQVFSQCWLKENLNAGMMILSSQDQTNNDIIEKYCMGDVGSYCNLLGGLYFWDEMMKYTNVTGGQGICPDGFHVPTDIEWQILEGAVDSLYTIGGPEWKVNGWRGTDAGGNLKQTGTELWEYPNTGATDAFGFSVIPSGYFVQGGFWGPGYKAYIWSSRTIWMYYRNFDCNQSQVQRNAGGNELAISVRCLKN